VRVRGRTSELALQVGERIDDRRSLESAITAPNCHLGQHSDGDESLDGDVGLRITTANKSGAAA
jgi:hypothetical protein